MNLFLTPSSAFWNYM